MLLAGAKKKFLRNYRDYGLTSALGKSFTHAFRFIYFSNTYRIYRKNINGSEQEVDCGQGLCFRTVKPGEESITAQIEEMEEWLADKVGDMLGKGALCIAVMDGDRLAGFNIASFGDIEMPLVSTSRRMRPDEAWSEQITVSRDYRGRGVATKLRRKMFLELGRMGIRRFYGGTLPSNRANLALSRKVGFQEIADIRYRKVLHARRWQVKRVGRTT